jgi:hypothetical protein
MTLRDHRSAPAHGIRASPQIDFGHNAILVTRTAEFTVGRQYLETVIMIGDEDMVTRDEHTPGGCRRVTGLEVSYAIRPLAS